MSACASCGATLEELAFPGAKLRCSKCGAERVAGVAEPAKAVYRAPGTRDPDGAAPLLGEERAESDRRCPRCNVALGTPVDGRSSCGRCSGDFVDHPAVAKRLAASDARRTTEPFRRRRRFDPDVRSFQCPVCREGMGRSAFGATSGIYLDACDRHGIWFDARELDDAMAYVSAVGLDVAKAPLPAPPPIASRGAGTASSTPETSKAALDAALGYELARDEADARAFKASNRNLIGLVLRLFG